jgi:uncharacterized protein YfaS (alpha-2-macroglobulin family)
MIERRNWINTVLTFSILISLVLGACASPTPGADATATPPGEATRVSEATRASEAAPTLTPLPTLTPMPLPAPRLFSRSPAPGEQQPPEAPLTLTFDQPMDRASVEAAFSISPTIEGDFRWSDDRTVTFVPEADLARGQRYQVLVAQEARNIEGKQLEEAIQFDLSTIGYLEVAQVMPTPGSEDLDPNTVLTVVFDRPVVPLTAINRQDELPQPLTLMPPVQGQGEWLNTAVYLFRPAEGLLPATHYRARVAAGLTDTTGAILAEDYTWDFSTLEPAVLQFWPPNGFQYLGPTEAITVTFNQPMDHASVQEHFALMLEDQPVVGRFRWSGGETASDRETMSFVPDEPLPRSARLEAMLGQGAMAETGDKGLVKATSWRFSTARQPSVVGTFPSNGARGVDPDGSVQITFASPMRSQGFLDHLSLRPAVTQVYTYWSEYNTQVRIYFERDPATTYNLTLDAATPDKFGAALDTTLNLRFVTGDLAPYAVLNSDGQLSTYNAYTETVTYVSHRNVTRLDLALYRLDPQTFVRLNSDWEAWSHFVPDESDLVRAWSRRVSSPRNEIQLRAINLLTGDGEPLPPGIYYLQLAAPEVRAAAQSGYQPSRYMFVKSRLNLTLKQTLSEALVWATDLASGQPVGDLPISLYQGTKPLSATGATDARGLFTAQDLPLDNYWDPVLAISGTPGEESFGIAYNGWDRGISPWDFDVEFEFWSSDYVGYLYTDRPIYRPGQTVYFKGILRADDDARYSLPDVEQVTVLINDPQGKELYKKQLPLNDMGTLNGELVLDSEAALGSYYLEVQEQEREIYYSTSFRVAEYRAPEYQVSVTTDRDAYLGGDTINVRAEATYYFGGPVANAGVHWSVLSSDYFFDRRCPSGQSCPPYSWTDYELDGEEEGPFYGTYGQLIAEGDAQTDEEGGVTFRVPADIADKIRSQVFTLEVSVTDINGQQVSNRSEAIVHKGEFYAGVAPQGYLAQVGQTKQVDLLTVDWDGEPVPGVELTVLWMEHRWYSVRREAEDGQFYWDWTAEDIPVLTTTVTTGDDGQAVAAFTPRKAGSYRVRAIGYDQHENEIRSSAYFWVWGGEGFVSWRQESNNRINLIADKEEYQVGDVAEILVPSPYTGTVQALITIERGHIMESEVRELESNSEVLRLPITEAHVPNVFVSILIVQGSDQAPDGLATFKMGLVKLPVSVASKELQITLTPDKEMEAGEHYGPRQTATYDVLVTDQEGEPVQAELSLRLADLAVLALADEPGPTLVEAFWRSRGLGVKTSTGLVVAMEAYNRELRPQAKGGGGDEGGGLIRSQFADTAFWDPVVRTDEDGRALVEVQLPDNLTTWRMQARGITADTEVGQAEVDILSTLDLLVRPVLPRFFVVGDKAEIATVVHNNTESPLEARVNISTEGLALEGEASQTVSVPAGDSARVIWPVTVLPGEPGPDGVSQVQVRMWASADAPAEGSEELFDGREDTLPVYRYATPEVVATAGRLSEPGLRQEIIQLPRELDVSQGSLDVQIDGSLTAATQDALAYLEHYPYECVEQTVSRFLPNVVTWQVLEEMDLERPELRQKLAQMVGVALQRLYAQQHYDGGWGWWVSNESNAYLTAYVLHGMLEAHRAGFTVDEQVMEQATAYLREELPSVGTLTSHWRANRLAYQLYVLGEYVQAFEQRPRGELGLAVRLFEARHLLDRYGQATLAVALALLEPDEPQRVQTLLDDLAGKAVASATGIHWQESTPDYWNMNTDVRTTAIVLWAFSRLEPDRELLPGVVRWLMAVRQEGHWESTQDTAWSLLGLVGYMRASGEMQGDFGWTIYLNGVQLASGQISKENIDESHKLQVEIARLLAEEANRLVIERQAPQSGQTGEGQLYYSAHLRYYLPADHVPALDRGLTVARQYSPVDSPGEYVDTAQVGDVIQVKLTLVAPTDLYYVVVEDPLPAGFEGIDLSLKTTSVVGERPELRNVTAEEESFWYRRYGWGWWWFSQTEMRDEKTVLFAEYLPRGTYEYTYLMRAGVPGEFLVLPATGYQMYFPEVFGRSDGGRFIVEPVD